MSVEDRFLTPIKVETEHKKTCAMTSPTAPITPIKIGKIDNFLSFMSSRKIDLQAIQFGTYNNGVFEKTEVEGDKTSIEEAQVAGGRLHLKRYSSSVF